MDRLRVGGYSFKIHHRLRLTVCAGLESGLSLFLYSQAVSGFTKTGGHKNILAGSGLGLLNFCNIALYIKAHMLLKDSPAIVFAGMNILVVLLGVMSGLLYFKEN